MNFKKTKTILALGLAIFAATLPGRVVKADSVTVTVPTTIHESKVTEQLSTGVKHDTILRFTTSGWYNINVLTINLNDQYTQLKGLIGPNGVSNPSTLTDILTANNSIAGVNGDYFNTSPASPLGGMVSEGEIITTPVEIAYKLPSFYLDGNNKGYVGYLDRAVVLTNSRSGQKYDINTINKAAKPYNTIAYLDSNWGAKSLGNKHSNANVEVLVVDNVVKEVRKNKAAFDIPKNGFVLSQAKDTLLEFKVGDKVSVTKNLVPSVENIKFAIGGGSIIVKEGQLTLTNINSKGHNPRTGIGINKDNTQLYLVTVDGRKDNFTGMSQELFGSILRDIGAYNALNLDGGGSTTMAVKHNGEAEHKVVNNPSDGAQRKVVNAVGVTTNAPIGELSYFKVNSSTRTLFPNMTTGLNISGFDANHNRVEFDPSAVQVSVTGVEATVNGTAVTPATSGEGNVIVTLGNAKGEMSINVLGPIAEISSPHNALYLSAGQTVELKNFIGKDATGYTMPLPNHELTFEVVGNVGTVSENKTFTAGAEAGSGAIVVKKGEAQEVIPVSIGSVNKDMGTEGMLKEFSASTYPETVLANAEYDVNAKEGQEAITLKYEFNGVEKGNRAAYLNFQAANGGIDLGSPSKVGFWIKGDAKGEKLRGTLVDANGVEKAIDFLATIDFEDWKYVETAVPTDLVGNVKLKRIYLVEGNIEKLYSGQVSVYGLTIAEKTPINTEGLPSKSKVHDSINYKPENLEGVNKITIAAYPNGLNEFTGYSATDTLKDYLNSKNVAAVLNSSGGDFIKSVTAGNKIAGKGAYAENSYYNTLFLTLESNESGLRAANSGQWLKLKNKLANAGEQNIVLLLQNDISKFGDKREANLLNELLVNAAKRGKNIFVVQGSNTSSVELKNGVRYVNLKTTGVAKANDIQAITTLDLYINNGSLSYELHKVYQ